MSDSASRIYQVTEQLHEKITYLCKEYDLHCAEIVGILYLIAHDLMAENTEEEE